MSTKKETLIERFIKGVVDAIRIPKVIERVQLALASGKNNLEDGIIKSDTLISNARKILVDAAKDGKDLQEPLNELLKLKHEKTKLKIQLKDLLEETKELSEEQEESKE